MKTKLIITTFMACWLSIGSMQAQVSQNPNKYLGNITTRGAVEAGNGIPLYYTLWNQITCENESKWSSVEGTRNSFNWSGADRAFNYAKEHNFTYKFHALVWGAQYPSWLENLSAKDRYSAITNWFDKAKAKYNTLPMIDVVNEAVGNHQPGNPMMKETLGGGGKTGYDWLIRAFDMAGERWPDAIKIYNDYNSLRWDVDAYITLVQTLRDAGAPIDAYGNQSHDVNDISSSELSNVLKKQQDALKMPMFITELDIDKASDAEQKAQYQKVLPLMWEAPYCAGVTLWGFIHGATWVDNSGLYKNGAERPAMTWIKEYMATEPAKTAAGPFPGTKKEASIYIRPQALKVAKDDVLPIKVHARLATKTIEKVDFYLNNELIKTFTEAPYVLEVSSSKTGWNDTKAVVTATDGSTYERYGRFQVINTTTKRSTFNEAPFEIPGTINITEYDKGYSGITYSNAARNTTTATKDGQWMEYTVDVKEDGLYSIDAIVASTKAGGTFHLAEYTLDNLTYLTEYMEVPNTGGSTKWQTMHGRLQTELKAGRHVFTVLVGKGGFYFDKLTLTRFEEDKTMTCIVSTVRPATLSVGDTTSIEINARSRNSTIKEVRVYANNLLIGTLTETPYVCKFAPPTKGSYSIMAIAIDAEGREKSSSNTRSITVNGNRSPFKSVIDIPGIIEVEDFDSGGEGLTFHDSDSNDEGDANYRNDNEGVDLVKGNGGTALGYTAANEWVEYSVNVTEAGDYKCVATVSSGTTNSGFAIGLVKNSSIKELCSINVPKTADNNWNTYRTVTVDKLNIPLEVGKQIFRITINGANCNIDKLELTLIPPSGISTVIKESSEAPVYNLYGVKVGTMKGWQSLPRGIYVVNGRKVTK